ncbi:SIMPL domain-containing protein [Rhodococcus hoagii]|nr:SIMPL domain-containing protein [Prescottella equi]
MPTIKTKRAIATAAAAGGLLVLTACGSGSPDASGGQPTGISSQGTGKVTGTPDTLTVVLGVQTQAPEAQAALQDNSQTATALIDTLKSKGVAAEDIRTSELSVNPTWEQSGRINGYQVSNQVTATLHDISQAGAVIDAAAAATGDAIRVQQTSFSISDDGDLRAEARGRAVQQAQDQARQMADAAGVKLGKVRSIVEVPPQAQGAQNPNMMRSPNAMAFDAVPLEAGSQELTVNVAVTYDID